MTLSDSAIRPQNPSVCIVSQRGIAPAVARCCGYEFEDVIRALTGADLITPRETSRSALARRVVKGLGKRVRLAARLPTFESIPRLQRTYDILLCVCQSPADLLVLNSVHGWRRQCRYAVCWLEEFWSFTQNMYRGYLNKLESFDRVFVNCRGGIDVLERRTRTACEYIPPGIDTLRFGAGFEQSDRCIDVLNLGRRSELTHRAIMEWADRKGRFYLFDTIKSKERVSSPQEHRRLLADLIRRAKFFVANRAKFNCDAQTGGQAELGFRFFEGAAGGAVLIGEPPQGPALETHFRWEDAVIPVACDAPDIASIIDELERDQPRMDAIRRRNVMSCCLQHDWLFRWARIVESLEFGWTEAMAERLGEVLALAASAGADAQSVEQRWAAIQAAVTRDGPSADGDLIQAPELNGKQRAARPLPSKSPLRAEGRPDRDASRVGTSTS